MRKTLILLMISLGILLSQTGEVRAIDSICTSANDDIRSVEGDYDCLVQLRSSLLFLLKNINLGIPPTPNLGALEIPPTPNRGIFGIPPTPNINFLKRIRGIPPTPN